MTFDDILDQILTLLKRQGRVSYRALKRRFALDDAYIEDLKEELIHALHVATDEEDRVLVWAGDTDAPPVFTSHPAQPAAQPPPQQDHPLITDLPSTESLPDAERRQLTVMFCDLVGSTQLSQQLDPEDLRDVIRAYQSTCAEVMDCFDGYIAQHLGDGLLVYFGFPLAHEDDAQRAVYAGLGILEAMRGLNTRLEQEKKLRLSVRIGVHTGLVVVGEMGKGGRQEHLALGETPNVASRIEGIAEPDTVAISAATYRLVQGYFVCDDLGWHTLKGVNAPQPAYRVVEASGAQGRLDMVAPRGMTPLVGREHEVALLFDRWQQVREGYGQVVLLSGEAGIGKSRLVQVLKEQITEEAHRRLECRSSPYYQNTALYPITDLLQRTLQWQQDDTPEAKLEQLERELSQYRLPVEESVQLFAPLLSLAIPKDRYPPLHVSPERQRHKTLEAILAMVLELADQQPVLLICEDLHWTDPSTLALLGLVIDQAPTASLFVVLTCRPTFQPPWGLRTHITPVAVTRLNRTQIEVMAERVAGGKTLPLEVRQRMAEKTDGVPLFVEEMTKALLESGYVQNIDGHYELTASLASLSVPETLQDALMARLDRLNSAKSVAQLGATLGRQFSYTLLQAISELDTHTLQRELGRLVKAEILYQRGLPPRATYRFKHGLITDIAYQSLLRHTRQQIHRRIAHVMETQFPDIAATQPELLAHHYTEAGLTLQALDAWQRAGRLASERSAHLEAMAHLTSGLALIEHFPEPQDRIRHELPLQLTLAATLVKAKGHGSLEVEQAYARARDLCLQLGDSPQLARVLYGLMGYYINRAAHQIALEIAQQLLAVAQRQQDHEQLLMAHNAMGTALYYFGEFSRAHAHLEQGIDLHDIQQPRTEDYPGALVPRVANLFYDAWTLWPLGYPDQALTRCREALALAQDRAHPFSITMTLLFTNVVYWLCGDFETHYAHTEAAFALATEHGFTWWLGWATFDRGAILAARGHFDDGMAQMWAGLTTFRNHGSESGHPGFLQFIAQAYGTIGQGDEALPLFVEALALVDQTQERCQEAELYRCKGELLLHQTVPDPQQAETCFHRALSIAQRQHAKSLELRAATSLARLWQAQGKRQEAVDLLAPVYEWFTEGFDTADLQEAKALLDELK